LSKTLKIAIIGSRGYPYIYSGYETLVKEISERLITKGFSVRVYCHSSLFIKKPKFINGIELVYTPSIETKFLSQIVNSFFSFVHVCFKKVDVVLVLNSANGPFGLLTKIFGIKTCINVDGLEWLRPKWKGFGSLYFKVASKLSTIMFDQVITDSYQMKKIYLKNFKKNSIVIAYGPTIKKIKQKKELDRYNLKTNEFYLIVGRLVPDNNAVNIIQGFIKSKSEKKLVIVGDVPYSDKYSAKAKSYSSNKIIFTGYIKSEKILSQLYNNCYGYIHGHQFGGTNPTMINSLEINCSVLALDTKFTKEMLKNKCSIFFENNYDSISESIKIFERENKKLKQKNKNYNLPNIYKWDYITDSYIKLIEDLKREIS